MRTLIHNARIINADSESHSSVLIDGSTIADIGVKPGGNVDVEIDAQGLVLIPGVVDDQVHFREPGLTHKEDLAHASRACAKGGVTSFLEMPNTIPNATNQTELDRKLDLGAQKSLVNYGFYIGATPDNVEDLKTARRTPGIKIFIGSSTGDLLVDDQEALERIFSETTLPICAHCEDEATVNANAEKYSDRTDVATHSMVRDHEAAVIATKRAIDLASRHQHRFHVLHVSTADEIPLIREAKGIVTAEICLHHIFFNIDDYERLGSLIKMNPSIKTARDNERLWQALLDGDIQVIATDHAPHTLEEKAEEYPKCPSGLPAIENSLALMLNQNHLGKCSLQQIVSWMCEAPARTWDIVGKGRIEVGYDADLVLVDPGLTHEVRNEEQQTKNRWSPWNGESLTGCPIRTWVTGREVFRRGENGEAIFDDSVRGQEIQFDHSRGGYWTE